MILTGSILFIYFLRVIFTQLSLFFNLVYVFLLYLRKSQTKIHKQIRERKLYIYNKVNDWLYFPNTIIFKIRNNYYVQFSYLVTQNSFVIAKQRASELYQCKCGYDFIREPDFSRPHLGKARIYETRCFGKDYRPYTTQNQFFIFGLVKFSI